MRKGVVSTYTCERKRFKPGFMDLVSLLGFKLCSHGRKALRYGIKDDPQLKEEERKLKQKKKSRRKNMIPTPLLIMYIMQLSFH